jgi:5-formyltetrahydrofolate cyclo-ligase
MPPSKSLVKNLGSKPVPLTKTELRRHMLTKREQLTATQIRKASEGIADQLKSLIQKTDSIAGYVPIRGEVDALHILTKLSSATMVLPCVVHDSKILSFRCWEKGDVLITGAHNIPCPSEKSLEITPDVVLVPLVAFDKNGFRLGYGGGYYDATLAALRLKNPAIQTIGLAYDFQQVDVLPSELHDVRLDMVIMSKV